MEICDGNPGFPRITNRLIRETLNHTPETCRKYYIHPALVRAYRTGILYRVMNSPAPKLRRNDGSAALPADERRVLKIITLSD